MKTNEVNRGMAFACILIRDGLPLNPYEANLVANQFNAHVPPPDDVIPARFMPLIAAVENALMEHTRRGQIVNVRFIREALAALKK